MNPEDNSNTESFSFPKAEQSILHFWNEQQIFKKSLQQTREGKNYIFYDGPPFATGLPHHGHIVASTIKDIIPRYFTMKGFYVDRRFGWDCHGLPIEQEIDKKFKMSANDFVAQHGVKEYNNQCRGIVDRYVNEWERTITRLGRWVDFQNDYKTMDLSFMESTWWVFKSIWEKDLIYQGNKIVPYSPALQTALSNFEAGQNYQDVQDPAVTVLFQSAEENEETTYYAAWTTTPWTLPSNLALCTHPEVDYVKVKDLKKDIFIILAKARLGSYEKILDYEIIEEFKGAHLKGKKYLPLFPYYEELKKQGYFVILNDDYVTTDDGTGIVHQAPGFGEDDHRVMKEAALPEVVIPLDHSAHFISPVEDFKGQFIKDADKNIIRYLKEKNSLLHQSTLVHSYPMCYRTDKPLIYRAMPQWYLNVEKIKEKMLQANDQIHWVPESIKEGRFGKWLENARDWAISRTRVWGTPLPIWINDKTERAICIGSIEELEKYSGVKVTDLHRESVDSISFSCPGEEGTYRRIPEVLDCWFESGSMPYAQLHYPFENKDIFQDGFPAEFIAEGLDQTRGWFYTLTVIAAALFDKPAFKNVIVNGLVLAADGKKMSKRLKNYTPPDDLIEKYGADSLRLFLINSGLVKGEELRFTDEGVKEMVRRALLPWYNSFKFFHTYAAVDNWKTNLKSEDLSENILDQWIISKLHTLIKNVNHEMQNYHLYNVVPQLFHFIEDLTNWYIRLNRRRFWEEGTSTEMSQSKFDSFYTLHGTLETLSKIMAPFAPFLSEHIFRELRSFSQQKIESVHLCPYPEENSLLINTKLEEAVDRMQQVILLGRQKRLSEGVKVKTPLKSLLIIHQDQELLREIQKLEKFIKIELNVKHISYHQNEADYVTLSAKANLPVLGKKLGKRMGQFKKLIENLPSESVQKIENGESINIEEMVFTSDEILVFRTPKEGTSAITNKLITIDLDCSLEEDLIHEGLAREIVNRIQKSRKDLNLNVSDRIKLSIHTTERLKNVFTQFEKYISQEVLMKEYLFSNTTNNDFLSHSIEDEEFSVFLEID